MTSAIKTLLRRTRRLVNQSLGRDVRASIQHRCRTQVLGTGYGGWCICPDQITSSSIIYSFGVGDDISFDLGLIERFGVHVHAFDPTPRAVQWIRAQKLPTQFHFHELGIGDHDGTASFEVPPHNYVSYSFSDRPPDAVAGIVEARVNRLATILRDFGHDRVDVLKMDVEGSEYGVIDDLAKNPPPIGQLLVEFHHTIGNSAEVERTRAAIRTINSMGFKLFYNSPLGREFSFIQTGR